GTRTATTCCGPGPRRSRTGCTARRCGRSSARRSDRVKALSVPLRFPAAARPAALPIRRVPARRRAAAAVVSGLVLCAAAQLGFGWAIDTERSPLRDPIYFDKLETFRTHRAFFAPPSPDRATTVLFVGSSRTLNAVYARAA